MRADEPAVVVSSICRRPCGESESDTSLSFHAGARCQRMFKGYLGLLLAEEAAQDDL